jgi:hypothetical protein
LGNKLDATSIKWIDQIAFSFILSNILAGALQATPILAQVFVPAPVFVSFV